MSLRPLHLSADTVEVLGFPGEIMLRLLKMLVLPLVAGSMIAGEISSKQQPYMGNARRASFLELISSS